MKIKIIFLFVMALFAQFTFAQTIPITELVTNKTSYVTGERAVLLASVRRHPTGLPNDEVYIEGTLNGQPIKMLSISAYHSAYVTSELATGSYIWETKVYTRNMTGANYYRGEIAKCDEEEIRLKRLYEDETDLAKRDDLTTAINENAANKAYFQNILSSMRVLRDTKQQSFVVSPAMQNISMLDPMVLTVNHINPVYYLGQSSTLKVTLIPANITSEESLEFVVRGEIDGSPILVKDLSSTEFSAKADPNFLTMGSHTFTANLYARSQHNSSFLRVALNYTINRKLELEILRDSSSNSALAGYYQREIDELMMMSNLISDVYSNGLSFVASSTKSIDVQSAVLSDVSLGVNSVCAIKGKSLSCWGNGANGGFSDTENKLSPTLVADLDQEMSQVTSFNDSCAIKNGGLYCWGPNTSGAVGNNSTEPALLPVQITIPGTVQKVSQGDNHACAISSGSLYCWGNNTYGQFGNGTTTGSLIPKLITLSESVVDVRAMTLATCVITVTQKLLCFGANVMGQLGDGTTVNKSSPVTIFSSGVTAVTGRNFATCAIVSGAAKCWGNNSTGRIGDGTTTSKSSPTNVTGMSSGVTNISVGNNHACAVVNGAAKCWGNGFALLGDGDASYSTITSPGSVSGMSADVDEISTGMGFTCLRKLGVLHCWGLGSYGQLGVGTSADSASIVQPIIPMD